MPHTKIIHLAKVKCDDCGMSWEGWADDVGFDTARHEEKTEHETSVIEKWTEEVNRDKYLEQGRYC